MSSLGTRGDGSTRHDDQGAAQNPLTPTPFDLNSGSETTFVAASDSDAVFQPGQIVSDQFEVVRLLGRGGMGAVYEVHDQLTGERQALKVILPSVLAKPKAAQRFVQEVNTARRLRHPGIVAVYDVRRAGGLLFFTMEYLEGRTLRRVMNQRGQLSLDETVRILARLCDALAYAHRFTVHRDLSPENVMILPNGSLKLLDFGIAKTLDPSSLTSSNMSMGKAYYMAPEQRKDAAHIDARADIWSLGVMFFEMLSGEMPMGYSKLTDIVHTLPPACENVVAKTIVPVERRFPSLAAFNEALRACLPQSQPSPTRATAAEPVKKSVGGEPPRKLDPIGPAASQVPISETRRNVDRNTRSPIKVFLASVVLVGALVVSALTLNRERPIAKGIEAVPEQVSPASLDSGTGFLPPSGTSEERDRKAGATVRNEHRADPDLAETGPKPNPFPSVRAPATSEPPNTASQQNAPELAFPAYQPVEPILYESYPQNVYIPPGTNQSTAGPAPQYPSQNIRPAVPVMNTGTVFIHNQDERFCHRKGSACLQGQFTYELTYTAAREQGYIACPYCRP